MGDKIFDPALNNSKDFNGLLVSSEVIESRGFIKLKSKISTDDVEGRPFH